MKSCFPEVYVLPERIKAFKRGLYQKMNLLPPPEADKLLEERKRLILLEADQRQRKRKGKEKPPKRPRE